MKPLIVPWNIWANYHISPESCGHFGMIALNHDANDGEQWGRKLIYSDQKHHSVTISAGNYHLRWWCEPPVVVATSLTQLPGTGWHGMTSQPRRHGVCEHGKKIEYWIYYHKVLWINIELYWIILNSPHLNNYHGKDLVIYSSLWINVDNIFKHVGKAEKFKCVDEILWYYSI